MFLSNYQRCNFALARFSSVLVTTAAFATLAFAQDQSTSADPKTAAMWNLIDNYCLECHNFEDYSGGVAFDIMSPDTILDEAEIWEAAVRKLRGNLMPPPGSPQPQQKQSREFISWMENHLDQPYLQDAHNVTVGHVPAQRLNRAEYSLSIKDLIGVDIDAGDYLPPEIEVDGFKNIARALTVSPSFLDQQVNLARAAAKLAVGEANPKVANTFYQTPSGFAFQGSYQSGFPLGTRGGIKFTHNFPADGEYRINILDLDIGLYTGRGETQHTAVVLVDGKEVFRGDVGGLEDLHLVNREGEAGRIKITERFTNIPAQVKAGSHDVTISFIERSLAESPRHAGAGGFGGLAGPRIINGVEVIGPFNSTGVSMSASREKIFVCYPKATSEELACAQQIAKHLAQRAYRRPVNDNDVTVLMSFFDNGRKIGGFDTGIEYVVTAVLASPDFLYRGIEVDAEEMQQGTFALNDLELATRLSFFLWSQGPDEELMNLAMNNKLSKQDTLRQQVQRMLKDPRAKSLVQHFALNWLNIDDLSAVEPDPNLFPGYSEGLQQDFSQEAVLFLESILLSDRPLQEMLTADYTFVNERLANHYGIDGVYGPQFRQVTLEDENRWGILGKGAVLLRTSYGDRTSPVLRGAWVLEKLMGTPPSPPPPNVETDLSVPQGQKATTVRARLEKHREQPSCNQCHGVIDPIGIAMENFDVIGRWRERDLIADADIDASTVLPTGSPIEGPVELRNAMLQVTEQLPLAVTEKLFMYSLGRELEYFDKPQMRKIVRDAEKEDYRLSALVFGIVNSPAFRYQSLPHADGHKTAAVQ